MIQKEKMFKKQFPNQVNNLHNKFKFKNFHNILNLNNNRKKKTNSKPNSFNILIKITNNIY